MSTVSNIDPAESILKRSSGQLKGALRALKDGRWDDVVYCSQMAVKQVSKTILIALGIDYPKEHDVSIVFKQIF